jgi:hypothetical protein
VPAAILRLQDGGHALTGLCGIQEVSDFALCKFAPVVEYRNSKSFSVILKLTS